MRTAIRTRIQSVKYRDESEKLPNSGEMKNCEEGSTMVHQENVKKEKRDVKEDKQQPTQEKEKREKRGCVSDVISFTKKTNQNGYQLTHRKKC